MGGGAGAGLSYVRQPSGCRTTARLRQLLSLLRLWHGKPILLWPVGEREGTWYRLREYYYDSRREGRQKTDEEYYAELETLVSGLPIHAVIVDPSAASFIACIRRHQTYRAIPAQNEVLDGIRRVSDALKEGKLRISPACRDTIREFGLYRWDIRAAKDAPRKEHDHAMDDIRYFVTTILCREEEGFYALATERR